MSSSLSAIPIPQRRRLRVALGLFAALFAAVGVVAMTGTVPGTVRVFAVIALVVAVLLGLACWGVVRSITASLDEQWQHQAIDAALAPPGGRAGLVGCGHDHDPDELHVTDGPCAHDGSGTECAHSCNSCVLAALRDS